MKDKERECSNCFGSNRFRFIFLLLSFIASMYICIQNADWSNESLSYLAGLIVQVLFVTLVMFFILNCFVVILRCLYFFICATSKLLLSNLKSLPKTNYHILGYTTFLYLFFITLIGIDNRIDYSYFEILRFLVTGFATWSAIRIYKKTSQSLWILIFSVIAILFNPIVKLSLDENIWLNVDILTIVLLIIFALKDIKKTKEK